MISISLCTLSLSPFFQPYQLTCEAPGQGDEGVGRFYRLTTGATRGVVLPYRVRRSLLGHTFPSYNNPKAGGRLVTFTPLHPQ